MVNKAFNILRIIYIVLVLIIISSFVTVVLYMGKHPLTTENAGLERWAIILTLACIFGTLKLLHPKNLIENTPVKTILKSYVLRFSLRALVLVLIYYFNLTCFFYTGTKNFIYLAFIVIFALFLCSPNKKQMKELMEQEKND